MKKKRVKVSEIRNSLIRISKLLLSADGWESPTGKRHSWRRKLNDGNYEYRYKDPSNKDAKNQPQETSSYPTRVPPKLASVLSVKEDLIRYNSFETLVCFDENGNKIFDLTGNEDSVVFSGKESLVVGNWLTHNHPRSTSFSREDIQALKKHKGKGIRVVSEKYDYEFCFLDDYVLNDEQTAEELAKLNMQVRNNFEDLILKGKLSIEDANANHQHTLIELFAKTIPGVFYARKPHIR